MTLATVLIVTVPTEYYVVQQAEAAASGPALTPLQQGFMDHIDHIIFLVLENHAFDSQFGTYCLQKSKVCPYTSVGLNQSHCIPLNPAKPEGTCEKPFNFTKSQEFLGDLGHLEYNATTDFNHGSMNDFYIGEGDKSETFGHFNGTTSPTFWDIAEEFTLDDNFFSSLLDYSLPNHWHIVAGQAPSIAITNTTETQGPGQAPGPFIQMDHKYLNESNATRSIEDLLVNSTVSWKYYDYTLGTYAKAIAINLNANKTQVISTGRAYDYWNPLAAKHESYTGAFVSHYVPNTQFYSDAKNGTLPSISWVIPAGQDSDHPLMSNNTVSQDYVASIVDAVETSPEWNSSILYITWDDWGGFYDSVKPPLADNQQLGFRVPLLVVSPYTAKGWIATSQGYFEAILRTMEWRFGLGCVATLDCKAPLAIWGQNFTHAPRAPVLFSTKFNESSYPYNPDWNQTAEQAMLSNYDPPEEFVYFPDGEAPDID
ncbi:MAG TPA: alkaline phosphatase family protein [Thermoplasmata archaeon]|nr:alkaline phosphatase family protein [Thermoplasmata archaeon]